jgi:hypothetical protein
MDLPNLCFSICTNQVYSNFTGLLVYLRYFIQVIIKYCTMAS